MTVLIDLKLKSIKLYSGKNKYWNISKDLGTILSEKILESKPKNILEIGTSNGYSTLCMAKNLDETSKITTIEVNSNRFLEAKNNFKDCNLKNIIQIQGEIFDLIENNKIIGKFDFIFIDAAQRMYLYLIKKLEKFNLLSKNVIIIADNVISHKNMGEFLEYMKKNYTSRILDVDSGFLISKSK